MARSRPEPHPTTNVLHRLPSPVFFPGPPGVGQSVCLCANEREAEGAKSRDHGHHVYAGRSRALLHRRGRVGCWDAWGYALISYNYAAAIFEASGTAPPHVRQNGHECKPAAGTLATLRALWLESHAMQPKQPHSPTAWTVLLFFSCALMPHSPSGDASLAEVQPFVFIAAILVPLVVLIILVAPIAIADLVAR